MELTTLGSMHPGERLLYSTGWPNLTGYCSCCSMDRLGLREQERRWETSSESWRLINVRTTMGASKKVIKWSWCLVKGRAWRVGVQGYLESCLWLDGLEGWDPSLQCWAETYQRNTNRKARYPVSFIRESKVSQSDTFSWPPLVSRPTQLASGESRSIGCRRALCVCWGTMACLLRQFYESSAKLCRL